jgi:NitT/TauT family transport system ATP-binding protein
MVAIKFEQVSQLFVGARGQTVKALNRLSFNIERNEFISIIGPSGCGKSTTLRLIAGLIFPSAGTVSIYGHQVREPPEMIGLVFQRPTLLPWLDILSNVIFPIRHKYGSVKAEERQKALKLLELVGLKEFANSRPDELSGGMQQRAAIARALLLNPEILLMDEPFSALDALTRDEMEFELLRIWAERPKTVVFVTHSIPEAVLLSDRAIVLTVRPGTVSEIVDIPLPRPRSVDTLALPQYQELSGKIRAIVMRKHNAQ